MSQRFHCDYDSPNTTEVTAVPNLVTNGDFSDGTTGWTPVSSSLAVASNVLSNTGTGGSTNASEYQTTGITAASGIKLYIKGKVRVTNAASTLLAVYLYGATTVGTIQYALSQPNPVQNTWYPISAVITVPADMVGFVRIRIAHYYPDAATQTGKVMQVQYVLGNDLSAAFGAGNEPTAVRMNKALALLNINSWFDGTTNIPTEWMLKDAMTNLISKRFYTLNH